MRVPVERVWRPEHQRELMFLLKGRWADFPAERRDLIGRRILGGPPGRDDEDEAERALRSATTAAVRLGWLVKTGCALPARVREKWSALKRVVFQSGEIGGSRTLWRRTTAGAGGLEQTRTRSPRCSGDRPYLTGPTTHRAARLGCYMGG